MANKPKDTENPRYRSLQERSYQQILRLKIFEAYDGERVGAVDFENYKVDRATEEKLSALYKNMGDVRKFNAKMKNYVSDNEKVKQFKKKHKKWFKENIFTCDEFSEFWGQNEDDRACKYCDITEKEIKLLIDNGAIKTKRLYSRGRTMEIDRKDPNGEYSEENTILSCYWCNNAKTDEFTFDEFLTIAEGFKSIWKARLGVL